MIAAHRGHVEMVYVLLKEGRADTTLEDSYGKKALDRANSSHISYLISSASIENRMKDMSQTLNVNEYSPESKRKSNERGRSRTYEDSVGEKTPTSYHTYPKSILSTSNKKRRSQQYTPTRIDPRLQSV